jgi:hypothetical protein
VLISNKVLKKREKKNKVCFISFIYVLVCVLILGLELVTRADLVAFINEQKEKLELEKDDLEAFVNAKITPKDVSHAGSVEDLVRSYLDQLSRGPANRIAKSLCSHIVGQYFYFFSLSSFICLPMLFYLLYSFFHVFLPP